MRSIFLAAMLLLTPLSAGAETRVWEFRVLLDDREVGRHRFTLRATGEQRELRSEAQFDVRLLFLSAYRYRHEALERWDGNCLRSLAARTDDNGERQTVNAAVRGGRFVVERVNGRDEHEGCVMSFAYWNPQILKAKQLLNVQTGELLPVNVTPQGDEVLATRGEVRIARRHRISAPRLQIDLWYAGELWVALEAPAAGGRRLRYELM